MQRKKRSVPRTEPCGTPDVTGTSGEHSPSTYSLGSTREKGTNSF